MAVIVYPFRMRDPLTGKWYRARWKASLEEINKQSWIVDGPPDTHEYLGATSGFQVYQPAAPLPEQPDMHPHRARPPTIDDGERFLVGLFLRRYATYCTRHRRFAEAQGAAALFKQLLSTSDGLAT